MYCTTTNFIKIEKERERAEKVLVSGRINSWCDTVNKIAENPFSVCA